MADRRMFTKKVTDDDNFMALSSSAQALYLHLSMSADDDGFCNQVSVSMFKAHASVQDLQALLEKRYIYQFENGVIVIKHWRMANALRKDRYTPTAFQEELAKLQLKDNGAYTWLPDGCQMVAKRLPQDSIGKDSIGKDSIDKNSVDKNSVGVGVGEAPPPKIETVPAESMSDNSIIDCVMNAWNSIGHVDKIRSIVPCTSRYNELMISVDMYGISDVLAAVNKVRDSQYLKKRGHIQFDNYINRNAIPKLLEGSYDVDFEKEKTKKTNFQDFEQRTYADDLEERLVNR